MKGLAVNVWLRRLKQRKLVQWAIAYVAAAFALIQLPEVVADSYAWPHAVMHAAFGGVRRMKPTPAQPSP